jgi:hypothetical protein
MLQVHQKEFCRNNGEKILFQGLKEVIMQRNDDYYYAEVGKLASVPHANKGNPLTGALDTWKEAEKMISAQKAEAGDDLSGQETLYNSLVSA